MNIVRNFKLYVLERRSILISEQIERHGARYPKKKPGKKMKSALKKLQGATITESSMNFINDFTYDLGEDDLTAYGALQSVTLLCVELISKSLDFDFVTVGLMTPVPKRIRDTVLLLAQIVYHSFVPQAALGLSILQETGH